MITNKKGQPITASRSEYSRKKPLVPNAADTSADEQTMIAESPSPFKNRNQTPQIPAPTNSEYRVNPQFHKDSMRYGGTGRRIGAANTGVTNYGASGDSKPGGYKGNTVITGTPTRGGNRVVGDGNQRKAIKSRSGKMKTNLDIFNPRVLHEAGLTKL